MSQVKIDVLKELPEKMPSLLNGVLGIRSFDSKGSSAFIEKVY